MKLHILSDLHIEFEDFTAPSTDADVVILAGDIHVGRRGLDWAMQTFPDKPVIYVPGNHEYYGEAIPKHTDKLRKLAAGTNVHILEQEVVTLGGVTFLGCTLWTDFELFGDPRVAGYHATQRMTDYKRIHVSPKYSRLRSIDTAVIHSKSRRWLQTQLQDQTGERVIVTHHAPSIKSLPVGRQEDLMSAAYASHLDDLVEQSGAKLWVHGHLHNSSDYAIGTTRFLCNPKGYPDERNKGFVPDLVVSV
ncbi:metallophosphoesterase [Moorena sp. SIO3F7]|uniref:metallophosphoesterase n=1 Tax=Moorena sp. SIO3F7 TaxID=2607839 RepID=UPI0013FE9AA4|nr:metallophosphoesterase [Moorena sp. SIO3F7]NEQ04416.1 phosphoesterase [Moorena sp. SIO3F7]